jgi:hypothetical protein
VCVDKALLKGLEPIDSELFVQVEFLKRLTKKV